jgi:hypothetical protein
MRELGPGGEEEPPPEGGGSADAFLVEVGRAGAEPRPSHDVGRDDEDVATSAVKDGGEGGGDDGMSE